MCEPLRYCFLSGNGLGFNRIIVSVPKKFFKRAVKRNLLKRRLREAYRTQKSLLPSSAGVDLLLSYSSAGILSSAEIRECVAAVLRQVAVRSAATASNPVLDADSSSGRADASNDASATVSSASPAALASNPVPADGEE